MNPKQIGIYTLVLQELIESYRNDPPFAHNGVWLTKYDWSCTLSNSEKIPVYLALIHPFFYTNADGNNISESLHPPHPRNSKPSLPTENRHHICQISTLLPSAVCPWRNVPTTIELDHKWPYSLGGPSTLDNRLELCKDCNKNKSSSFNLYPTDRGIPRWLSDRVQQLFEIKQ